ncbi:MAG TPA: pyridoxal-phosphate dependent enzyme, partial [Anaeromyxobacteraceae bacterium]
MTDGGVLFACHGCGAVVDAARALPFRCPRAGAPGDDTDHLLVPEEVAATYPTAAEAHPFLRYRALLSPYRLARAAGLPDAAWSDLVGALDEALVRIDGRGFRVTPLTRQPELARAAGLSGELWVKDETGNVSGSHKARHLMGVMLYLRVLETARLAPGEGLRRHRLAIASCGNAALAAAVVARAADWPLEVFIPPDASAAVVRRLTELGATVTVCERRPAERGDPCFLRFRQA